MSKYVVVVFPDEPRAYQGSAALRALEEEGSISVYAMAVVAREDNGEIGIRQAADPGPLGMGVGALLGGLIGVVGGPAGVALGIGVGTTLGGLSDLDNAGVVVDCIDSITGQLKPGMAAVVAEIEEEWISPLDSRMEALGGIVSREWRSELEDARIEQEARVRKAEWEQLRAEHAQARDDRKIRLEKKLDEAQAKLTATHERAARRLDALNVEMDAKAAALRDRAKRSREDSRVRLDARITEVQERLRLRSEKLKDAWQLTI